MLTKLGEDPRNHYLSANADDITLVHWGRNASDVLSHFAATLGRIQKYIMSLHLSIYKGKSKCLWCPARCGEKFLRGTMTTTKWGSYNGKKYPTTHQPLPPQSTAEPHNTGVSLVSSLRVIGIILISLEPSKSMSSRLLQD